MALIVEDGTIVADADSYVSRADYIAHALSVGVVIVSNDAADVELRKAAQFIDAHEGRLKGNRSTRDQPMAFPRYGVVIDSWQWAEDEIPRQVVLAQLALALDIHAGEDLYNPTQSLPVIKKRVEGAVEVAYASPTSFKVSKDSNSRAVLGSLLKASGISLVRA